VSAQPVLLGIDIGTTSARAVALDLDGAVIADASADYPLSSPHPGWSEQDPADWWRSTQEALRAVAVAGEVVGVGLTGQMHGAVFLNDAGEVIRPALLWNDQRTARQCAWITEQVGAERLIAITGNPALTGFQAPKIIWLRDEEPESFARVRSVLLPKDYIRYRLTGEFATDVSDAAGTLLLDMRTRDWSPDVLSALGIPREWLPRVHEGPEVSGYLHAGIAAELGLPAGIPVAAGGGDNAAAAVGTGIIRAGVVSSSIGTSGVLFAHAESFAPDPSGRLHAFCHAVPGAYHLMGVTLSAGGSLRWWRDAVATDSDYTALAEMAASVPAGAEGLLFLPYLSGERTPHMDPDARGAFVGLTLRHTHAHMVRAIMEGVVFSLRDALEIMRALNVQADEVRATGGGGRHPLWLQLQADIFNTPIYRTTAEEGPAYGAALLGGVAAGVFPDVPAACERVTLRDEVTMPDPQRVALYDERFAAYGQLYGALKGIA
jgi:xylulokinase